MSALESLPADQQAVLSMLVSQHKSYAEISEALGLSESAVSERAYSALVQLANPEKAPAGKKLAELSDYLLGQQSEDQAAKSREGLTRSPSDRAWARAAVAPLVADGANDLPQIPGAPAGVEVPSPPASTSADVGSRSPRSGLILIAGVCLLGAIGIGFFVGRVTGGNDSPTTTAGTSTTASSASATPIAQAALKPPAGAPAAKAIGVAEISLQGGGTVLSVVARSIPEAPAGKQYGVWLTASGKPPVWLGYFQAIGKTGGIALQGTLSGNPRLYNGVQVTLEKTGAVPTSPSTTYLVGPLTFSGK